MSDEDPYAPPPFTPDEACGKLSRELRALGLTEREGRFERHGQVLARAAVAEGQLRVAMVKRPSKTSPEWQTRTLTSSAAMRDFLAELKKRMSGWTDRDD